MTKLLNISVITGSRAEFDRQYWLLKDLFADKYFDVQLIVMGMHMSKKFGQTIKDIEKEGFPIIEKINVLKNESTREGIEESIGRGTAKLAKVFSRLKSDIVLIYGDRHELLSVICACLPLQIPIAHIGGGQITEGAIDDQVRNAITKAAHLHCVANEQFAQRIKQMGEESWRIKVTGSPAIDCIKRQKLLSQKEIMKILNFNFRNYNHVAMVTFHPETIGQRNFHKEVDTFISVLKEAQERYGLSYCITYPNAEYGSYYIIDSLEKFAYERSDTVKLFKNLGQKIYLSMLANVQLMIGNSSSGIIESASFNLPAVNVGDRQKGRLYTENVFHVRCQKNDILKGVKQALEYRKTKIKNLYGDMNASNRIIKFIKGIYESKTKERILRKRFVDMEFHS